MASSCGVIFVPFRFWALFLHLICPIKLWEHLLWQAGAGHKVTRLGIFLEAVTVRGRSLILSVLKFNWLWLWYFHEHLRYFVFISTTKILGCMEKLGFEYVQHNLRSALLKKGKRRTINVYTIYSKYKNYYKNNNKKKLTGIGNE